MQDIFNKNGNDSLRDESRLTRCALALVDHVRSKQLDKIPLFGPANLISPEKWLEIHYRELIDKVAIHAGQVEMHDPQFFRLIVGPRVLEQTVFPTRQKFETRAAELLAELLGMPTGYAKRIMSKEVDLTAKEPIAS